MTASGNTSSLVSSLVNSLVIDLISVAAYRNQPTDFY